MRVCKRGKSWAVAGEINCERVGRIVGNDKEIARQVLYRMESQASSEERLGIRKAVQILNRNLKTAQIGVKGVFKQNDKAPNIIMARLIGPIAQR